MKEPESRASGGRERELLRAHLPMPFRLSFLALSLAILLFSPLALAQAEKASTASAADKKDGGDAGRGKKLYKTHCALCHFFTSTAKKVGPSLKGVLKQEKLPDSRLPATEKNVRKAILEGTGSKGMKTMPAYKGLLKPKEIDDLLAYLKTL